MKYQSRFGQLGRMTLLTAAMLAVTACGTTKVTKDPAVEQARSALISLQSDPKLANLAPTAIRDAEIAVQAAEKADFENKKDPARTAHLAYLAQNQVEIARAQAGARYEEDQVKNLADKRSKVLLESSTREANQARLKAQELERELADLKQKQTDRGLVFTLGDVLFATGKADIKPGTKVNIDRLAQRLNQEPNRTIIIEGHTDSTGSEALNDRLSQQRADSVKIELINAGVSSSRITAVGKGQHYPVASNNTNEGRQQNRRVEVILQ